MARQARILDFEEARSSSSRRTSQSRSSAKASSRTSGTKRAAGSSRSTSKGASTRSASKSTSRPLGKTANSRSTSKGAASSSSRGSSKAKDRTRKSAASSKRSNTTKRSGAAASSARTNERADQLSRFEQVKRDLKKKYADFKFNRSGMAASDAPAENAPRAALYKGEMGSSHKKATRMQDGKPVGFSLGRINLGTKSSIALVVCVCLLVGTALLYTPMKNYYTAVRDQAKAEVAYEIVTTRNDALTEDMSLLSTDAGMEDRARENYGWVKPGENSVTVVGLEERDTSAAEVLRTVTLNDIKAPETWYSPFFDSIFGYDG